MKNKLLLLAMGIALSTQTLMAQVPSYVPSDGLVGYWPFNDNANDVSGNKNNGTVNGATKTTDRFGNSNSAYSFDGLANYITVPSNSSISNFPNGQSLSFWINISSYPTDGKEHYMIDKSDDVGKTTTKFYQTFISDRSNVDGVIYRYANTISSSSQGSFASNSNIPLNQWIHICYTTDLKTTNTYINGVLFQTYIQYSPIGVTSNPLLFGKRNTDGSSDFAPFKGKLDDIAILNRVLTQQEITNLYNGFTYSDTCNAVSGSLTQGLVGYWPFCGNANDDSGKGNNGTVNGATLTTDRFGNANSAYHFDGNQENIKIQNSILPSTATSFTISMWIKYNGGTGSPRDVICDRSTSNYSYKYRLIEGQVNNNQIYGWYSCSTETCSSVNANNLSSNWENIIGVVDVTDQKNMRLYRNGILIGTSTNGYQYPTELNSTYIGANVGPNGALDPSFLGEIDDIGIWNRALSPTEVSQLYNQNQCFTNTTVTDTLIINVGQLSYTNPIAYSNNITIAPNPASSQININFNNITDLNGGTLKIINSLGQEVATTPITTSGKQSIMQLSTWGGSGMYFVQIINPQGIVVDVKKIILQ